MQPKENKATQHAPSKPSTGIVEGLLYRLLCQWSLDSEKVAGKRQEMEKALSKHGERRLTEAVDRILQEYVSDFFPAMSIILTYMPPTREEQNDAEWADLKRERRANPDAFCGWADILSVCRISAERDAGKLEKLTEAQMWTEVLQRRKTAIAASKERRGGPMVQAVELFRREA